MMGRLKVVLQLELRGRGVDQLEGPGPVPGQRPRLGLHRTNIGDTSLCPALEQEGHWYQDTFPLRIMGLVYTHSRTDK